MASTRLYLSRIGRPIFCFLTITSAILPPCDARLSRKLAGSVPEFDGAQDYDLFLRVIGQSDRIHHIPRVLYHWRRSEASSAISVRQKPGQLDASRLAIEDHLKRRGESGHVAVDWRTHAFCVRRELARAEKISILIPTRSEPEQLAARCRKSDKSDSLS